MGSMFFDKVREYRDVIGEKRPDFSEIVRSPFFYRFLYQYMNSLTRQYAVPLSLKLLEAGNEQEVELSRLDGQTIYINIDNELIRGFTTDENKTFFILGCLFHEIGHYKYMDFKGEQMARKAIDAGHLPFEKAYLEQVEEVPESLLESIRDPYYNGIFQTLYKGLAAVISNYHDEECICREGGSMIRTSIRTMREGQFTTVRPLEDMLEDRECASLTILLSMILQYARYGYVFVLREDTYEDNFYLRVLDEIRPDIERAMKSADVREKYLCINDIVVKFWTYTRIVMEEPPHGSGLDYDEASDSTYIEPGDTIVESEDCNEDCENCNSEQKKDEDAEGQEGETNCGKDGSTAEDEQSIKDQIESAFGSSGSGTFSDQPANILKSGMQQAPEQEKEIGPQDNSDYDAGPGQIVELALQEMAEDMLEEEAEEMAAEEQHSNALATMHTGNVMSVHFGIHPHVRRVRSINGDREAYEKIVDKYRPFIKKTEREIRKIIQEETAALQRRRMMGRQIDTRNLYKVDQRYFAKKKNPEKHLDMAITVLVDNSGSMEGKRMTSAKEATVLLTEVLERLNVPCFLASHNSDDVPCINIYKYFEDKKGAKYAVNRMAPSGDNRDGLALMVVGDMLTERIEEDKLLIIISDGQPNSSGYAGNLAKKDIKSIVSGMRQKGIKTIAFAIGDDKKQIRDIYGEAFVDISDYEKFPKQLASMIEREILDTI